MSTPTEDDRCNPERLLQLLRSEDSAALDAIVRCYGARLMSAGRQHCRTNSEAEDAVQDTLLHAAGGLESFRGEGSLEGYLVRVVARACRRLSRGHKNDASIHDAEAIPWASDEGPEGLAARTELGEVLDGLISKLEPSDRVLLLLAEFEDYSAAEIGQELGLTEGAVRTRLSRLRKRLRDELLPWLSEKSEK